MNQHVISYEPAVKPMSLAPRQTVDILQSAVERGASVEVIERLMDLAEKDRARQAKQAFDRAMAAALAVMPTVLKTASADRYKYETLDAVVDAVRGPLSDQGLSFRWRTDQKGHIVRVTCIVSHADGHAEETALEAPPEAPKGVNAVQAIGATVSYLQRYTLKAALGVAAAQDTDGRVPQGREAQQTREFDPSDILERIDTATSVEQIAKLRPEIGRIPPGPVRVRVIQKAADRIKMLEANNADG